MSRTSADADRTTFGVVVVAAALVLKVTCVVVSGAWPGADTDFLRTTSMSFDVALLAVLGRYFALPKGVRP